MQEKSISLHYSPQKAQKSQKTNIKRVTALNYVIFRKIIFYFNSFIFNNIRGYSSNSWTGELIGLVKRRSNIGINPTKNASAFLVGRSSLSVLSGYRRPLTP